MLDIPTKILKYTFDILDRHAKMVKQALNNGANISTSIDASFKISANNLNDKKYNNGKFNQKHLQESILQ